MTLGGGLTNEKSIDLALEAGADKVFFNSIILKILKI